MPPEDYEKYINPDDLLNESFEKIKGEFEFYRQRKGEDIIKEEMEQRKQHQERKHTFLVRAARHNQRKP